MIAGLKRVLVALVLIGGLAAAGFFGWRWYDRSREVQFTDDAYVRGEITSVSARVTGYAVEILTDDNLPVKAAQVVARIDPRDFRMNVDKAQATLDQAKANLAQIGALRELEKSKILVAEAALRSAMAQTKNAELALQRAATLAAKSFASQATVDADTAAAAQTRSGVDEAQANLAFAREQLVVIDSNEAVARAQVESAEASLLSAKFALTDTEIWAPISGIVANRKTRVGEYVTAGTRLLSIVPTADLWIEANYRETQIGNMKVGDPARIDVDTFARATLCGYVESIAPAAGSEFALIPPDNATGNFTKIVRRFTVRIRFNASEGNAGLARPGMSVETRVAVSTDENVSATDRARRFGCAFDPSRDIVERALTKLPEHPGLGRARPQGETGTKVSPEPAQ
jgi:membrane fusion protein (multidrug efflux system)